MEIKIVEDIHGEELGRVSSCIGIVPKESAGELRWWISRRNASGGREKI
jgi:hypothetical protein